MSLHGSSMESRRESSKTYKPAGTAGRVIPFPGPDANAQKENAVFEAWDKLDMEFHEIVRNYRVGYKFINRAIKSRTRAVPPKRAA